MKKILIVATAAGKPTLTRYAQTLRIARFWQESLEALQYSVRMVERTA